MYQINDRQLRGGKIACTWGNLPAPMASLISTGELAYKRIWEGESSSLGGHQVFLELEAGNHPIVGRRLLA